MVEFLYYEKFTLIGFKLDYLCILVLNLEIADLVKVRYKKFIICAKTKFYIDLIKVYFKYLKLIII